MKTTTTGVEHTTGYKSENSDSEAIKRKSTVDPDYLIGLICLAVNLTWFILVREKIFSQTAAVPSFILPYGVAVCYAIFLLTKGKLGFLILKKKYEPSQPHRLLLGLIWLVSCFSLNLSIPVFNNSAPWLSIAIATSGATCILFGWTQVLPSYLNKILFFFLGASTILWCYYAIYLAWIYPISLLALIFLGLSAHSFIPLLLSIAHFRILRKHWGAYRTYILAGISLPVLFMICFCVAWNSVSNEIRRKNKEITVRTTDALPGWVLLGQSIGTGWISKRVIMGDLVYQMPGEDFSLIPSLNSAELAQHDPLVLIASLFSSKTNLSETERTKLLDVLFDSRHDNQERLWTGSDLKTDDVVTQARIYPDFRLAYTEKTISIRSYAQSSWQQEEALYTFYMPEGSVVSALSLWIDGKEEKSYLTTHRKAARAYNTIVGVERKDPSVIHWQEGNTVKVKVFPCTKAENRKFKIGITSPLQFENNQLVYENVWFKGPDASHASELIKLDFSQKVNGLGVPFGLEEKGINSMSAYGKYQSVWKARFEAVPLSSDVFSFRGKTYSMKAFNQTPETFTAKKTYLDLNKAWSKAEFEAVLQILKNKAVYVFDEQFIQVSDTNKDQIFDRLGSRNFSLFPIHLVSDRENALLVTKANAISPDLKDLADSNFFKELSSNHDNAALKTVFFGEGLSPYLKTLRELRMIRTVHTDVAAIRQMISLNQFPADQEKDTTMLAIDPSKTIIQETSGSGNHAAPDHLLRLFAYNHIMKEAGRRYLDKGFQNDSLLNLELVQQAEEAHIVTPVSSLIVLETQKDYDRFGIKKSKNSLDNATLKSAGAVPEPHEWALILLFGLLIGYYTFRNYVR
jgi:XrtN system VIT domain protein